jgi:sec-independent protein translocase protein TatB
MEIAIVLLVALLVLGPHKLPEAGRQVGKFMGEIRRWSDDIRGEVRSAMSEDEPPRTGMGPLRPPEASSPSISRGEGEGVGPQAAATGPSPADLQPSPSPDGQPPE